MARQPGEITNETIPAGKKLFFVSDAHLGLPPREQSLEREKKLVKWLDDIKPEAYAIYFMGDIFDYWFEYRRVVPRGFVRFLGKIAELHDAGIPLYYFTGNHDVWVFDYLPSETGVVVYRKPVKKIYNNKSFYLAHGDGLGKGQFSYKLLKAVFVSKPLQWMYARLHPNATVGFAHRWSKHSRMSKHAFTPFMGEEKEHLIQHSVKELEKEETQFFVYGHRHLPMDVNIGKSRVICLGDWYMNYTYGVFDGNDFCLKEY